MGKMSPEIDKLTAAFIGSQFVACHSCFPPATAIGPAKLMLEKVGFMGRLIRGGRDRVRGEQQTKGIGGAMKAK